MLTEYTTLEAAANIPKISESEARRTFAIYETRQANLPLGKPADLIKGFYNIFNRESAKWQSRYEKLGDFAALFTAGVTMVGAVGLLKVLLE